MNKSTIEKTSIIDLINKRKESFFQDIVYRVKINLHEFISYAQICQLITKELNVEVSFTKDSRGFLYINMFVYFDDTKETVTYHILNETKGVNYEILSQIVENIKNFFIKENFETKCDDNIIKATLKLK